MVSRVLVALLFRVQDATTPHPCAYASTPSRCFTNADTSSLLWPPPQFPLVCSDARAPGRRLPLKEGTSELLASREATAACGCHCLRLEAGNETRKSINEN